MNQKKLDAKLVIKIGTFFLFFLFAGCDSSNLNDSGKGSPATPDASVPDAGNSDISSQGSEPILGTGTGSAGATDSVQTTPTHRETDTVTATTSADDQTPTIDGGDTLDGGVSPPLQTDTTSPLDSQEDSDLVPTDTSTSMNTESPTETEPSTTSDTGTPTAPPVPTDTAMATDTSTPTDTEVTQDTGSDTHIIATDTVEILPTDTVNSLPTDTAVLLATDTDDCPFTPISWDFNSGVDGFENGNGVVENFVWNETNGTAELNALFPSNPTGGADCQWRLVTPAIDLTCAATLEVVFRTHQASEGTVEPYIQANAPFYTIHDDEYDLPTSTDWTTLSLDLKNMSSFIDRTNYYGFGLFVKVDNNADDVTVHVEVDSITIR